ncbi:RNA polymerase factor sigma-54 [Caldimonas sp. KR1-144]|uniref:RNA polymerase factor sigma-54 n=1 Tax=Caldimonas sp. KR1-144 TaxID=3400911 RepID=UPI003C0AEFCA
MTAITLRTEARQQTTLSPRLQQAVRLLQMSSTDYLQQLGELMQKNPFLEVEDSDGEPQVAPGSADPLAAAAAAAAAPETSEIPAVAESDATLGEATPLEGGDVMDSQELWQSDGSLGSGRGGGSEDGTSIFDRLQGEDTLAGSLHGQLNLLPLSPRDLALAHAIVDCLDDDGYLRIPLEDLTSVVAPDDPASVEELRIALRRVQSLEPLGVGATSVAECLRLQLPLIAGERERHLAEQIVCEHLDELAAHDIGGLARALRCDVVEIEAVCERIRRLDPRPGWRFGNAGIQYLTPDVIVKKVRGQWTASLNPAVVPHVRLNLVYAKMFERHRCAHNGELADHLQEAKWAVRNVEQRFATILSVAQEIVRRQKHFFDYGPLAMKPLGLREVAREVGLHESTVSRVTNNKYMATPMGVLELKYFFSRAMSTAGGGACTATAIRELIHEMIAAEDPTRPLSDGEITRQLGRQGLVVARRTVTKYRQSMQIESADRRRKLAWPAQESARSA